MIFNRSQTRSIEYFILTLKSCRPFFPSLFSEEQIKRRMRSFASSDTWECRNQNYLIVLNLQGTQVIKVQK